MDFEIIKICSYCIYREASQLYLCRYNTKLMAGTWRLMYLESICFKEWNYLAKRSGTEFNNLAMVGITQVAINPELKMHVSLILDLSSAALDIVMGIPFDFLRHQLS